MARKAAKNRKCIVCKNDFTKDELHRFVKNLENEVIFDVFTKAPGKGAYVCNDKKCLKLALEKQIIGKVLQAKQPQDLKEQMLKAIETKFSGSVSVLNKAGLLLYGTEKVIDAAKHKKLSLVIFAEDASSSTKDKINIVCEQTYTQVTDFLDKTHLENITNTANTAVLGLKDSTLTDSIEKAIESYKIISST